MATATGTEHAQPGAEADYDLKDRYEIIDGQRVELLPMSAYASIIANRVLFNLFQFARSQSLGVAVMEVLFHLDLPVDRNRRLDVAFVSYQRWPKERRLPEDDNAWDVVPDLAAEIVSPNDLAEDLAERVEEFFRAGVRVVWLVYPRLGLVYVYESQSKIRILRRSDELDGGNVLPGFRLPLTEIFEEEPNPT